MSKIVAILGIVGVALGGIAAVLDTVAKSSSGGLCNDDDQDYYPILDGGVDWFCDCCGTYMNSQPKFSTITGMWICTECGYINDVTENNITHVDESDHEPDDSYIPLRREKEYKGYVPSGCRACGGPYPDCMSSCKIFDD